MNSTQFERVVKRGQAYYVHKTPPYTGSRELHTKSGRPGIIVSRDAENFMSGTVMVVYLTGEKNIRFPRETQYKLSDSQLARSVVKCEQIDTIDKNCLGDYICDTSPDDMREIDDRIVKSLGLDFDTGSTIEYDKLKGENKSLRDELTEVKFRLDEEMSKSKCEGSQPMREKMLAYKEKSERYEQLYKDLLKTLAGREI